MGWEALSTERLLLRPARPNDVGALVARRNEPDVAEFQSWSLPYPAERAQAIIDEVSQRSWPVDNEWWMLTIELLDTKEVIGDLALHQTWDGRSMEIGYTIGTAWWGRGFATEAVERLVERLFADDRMTRVHAMLHPGNTASARVLEHTGFDFEGRTVQSYWVGDDNSDDLLYGLTRSGWQAWRQRPKGPPAAVGLVVLDDGNVDQLRGLRTHWTQEQTGSCVEALLAEVATGSLIARPSPEVWLQGIVVDGEFVGCVGVTRAGSALTGRAGDPTTWTIIDRRHQGRGIEAIATELATEQGCPPLDDRGEQPTVR